MRHERPVALIRLKDEAAGLSARLGGQSPQVVLEEAITHTFRGEIALVSSFGAASVVLLHMVSRIAPATPVLFLETGKHFAETLSYRDTLVSLLGLTDVRSIRPAAHTLAAEDADGALHASDPATCCRIRKVDPLAAALDPFTAWITGRRDGQTASRENLPLAQADASGRIKLNPLAAWTRADVADYLANHRLPEHPLVAGGYASIGCAPCTTPTAAGEAERAGRWRGLDREECGIHFENGRLVRTPPATSAGAAAPLDLI